MSDACNPCKKLRQKDHEFILLCMQREIQSGGKKEKRKVQRISLDSECSEERQALSFSCSEDVWETLTHKVHCVQKWRQQHLKVGCAVKNTSRRAHAFSLILLVLQTLASSKAKLAN